MFSTKNRAPLISADFEPRLFAYLGGILRDHGARLLAIGGMPDHVHLIIRDSKSVTDIQMMKDLKGGSSKWVNESAFVAGGFAWQAGYGWFSVGPRGLEAACDYVHSQKAHHQRESFQDEFRKFLRQYGVDFDERYVWD
ncbi:MAG: transposase [Opitutales bacterium]|nr:transposase [Opitutales bacterium]